MSLKLGWHIGYWGRGMPENVPATLKLIEELGYDSAWTAERMKDLLVVFRFNANAIVGHGKDQLTVYQ